MSCSAQQRPLTRSEHCNRFAPITNAPITLSNTRDPNLSAFSFCVVISFKTESLFVIFHYASNYRLGEFDGKVDAIVEEIALIKSKLYKGFSRRFSLLLVIHTECKNELRL